MCEHHRLVEREPGSNVTILDRPVVTLTSVIPGRPSAAPLSAGGQKIIRPTARQLARRIPHALPPVPSVTASTPTISPQAPATRLEKQLPARKPEVPFFVTSVRNALQRIQAAEQTLQGKEHQRQRREVRDREVQTIATALRLRRDFDLAQLAGIIRERLSSHLEAEAIEAMLPTCLKEAQARR